MLQAIALQEAVRRGPTLLLVFGGDDGRSYLVRCADNGDGVKSLVVDWLSAGLAALLHLPVLAPVTIEICGSDLVPACMDSELGEMVDRIPGVMLAVPCIEDATVLCRGEIVPVLSETSDDIFLFDVLVGNIDRTWDNASILRTRSRLCYHDFSCSMAMRSALEGRDSAMFQSGVFRRHPCYREGVTAKRFRRRVQAVSDTSLAAVAATVPDIWLLRLFPTIDAAARERKVFRALQIVRDRVLRLEAMIAAIERSQVDPEGRRVSRMLGNRTTFLAFFEKIGPCPQVLTGEGCRP